jgi:hypothetical protein
MNDSEKLIQLKELLLTEDRDFAQKILHKLDSLEDTLYIQDKLSEKVNPIIDYKLEQFVEGMPKNLGPVITSALSEQIKNSQELVVNALFPIIGKMIKKYIQQEMALLSESINSSVQDTFSVKKWQRKFKGMFFGYSEEEMILNDMGKAKVQQIFIIERGSGLVIANASKTESIDEDMIAGMLTAIKSFVEDALLGESQSLELIEYELNKIYLQNVSNYYFAVVISGNISESFKDKLETDLFDFANEHIKLDIDNKSYIIKKLNEFLENE